MAILSRLTQEVVCGKDIRLLALDPRVFDSKPEGHRSEVCLALRKLYDALERAARDDGRLSPNAQLIRRWTLSYDIYSGDLRRLSLIHI